MLQACTKHQERDGRLGTPTHLGGWNRSTVSFLLVGRMRSWRLGKCADKLNSTLCRFIFITVVHAKVCRGGGEVAIAKRFAMTRSDLVFWHHRVLCSCPSAMEISLRIPPAVRMILDVMGDLLLDSKLLLLDKQKPLFMINIVYGLCCWEERGSFDGHHLRTSDDRTNLGSVPMVKRWTRYIRRRL
jgi:hypothetical protein